MKKSLTLAAALILVLGLVVSAGAQDNQPKDVNGYAWEQSAPEIKNAYLVGVNSMVAMDIKIAELGGKEANRFAQGYYEVLKDTDNTEIIRLIDNWYAQNPDKKDRYVLSVVYFQLIHPQLKK